MNELLDAPFQLDTMCPSYFESKRNAFKSPLPPDGFFLLLSKSAVVMSWWRKNDEEMFEARKEMFYCFDVRLHANFMCQSDQIRLNCIIFQADIFRWDTDVMEKNTHTHFTQRQVVIWQFRWIKLNILKRKNKKNGKTNKNGTEQ